MYHNCCRVGNAQSFIALQLYTLIHVLMGSVFAFHQQSHTNHKSSQMYTLDLEEKLEAVSFAPLVVEFLHSGWDQLLLGKDQQSPPLGALKRF